jgi:hypothetical protein
MDTTRISKVLISRENYIDEWRDYLIDDILKKKNMKLVLNLEFSMYLTYLCMRNKKYGNYIWFKKRKNTQKKVISFDGTLLSESFLKPLFGIYDKYKVGIGIKAKRKIQRKN